MNSPFDRREDALVVRTLWAIMNLHLVTTMSKSCFSTKY